jgi:hypothetical protein
MMEVSTAPEVLHYSGKLIPALFECPCCLKNVPKNRLCFAQYKDIIDHFSLDTKLDITSGSSWEQDDELSSHKYLDRMKEIDGMGSFTKVVHVDEHGEMIPKGSFLEKDFMSSNAAKYPRMRLVLQKSNKLIFKFLQKLKVSKNLVYQIKNAEDLDKLEQQEFLWFKKVWISRTFQGKFFDAHGMEVLAINLLELSMDVCDECCVTIDVSIVTKLDRSKGELVPQFPSFKVPMLSSQKSLAFSRLGLGLSSFPKQHELPSHDSPGTSSKGTLQDVRTDKHVGMAVADLSITRNLSPTILSNTASFMSSPIKNKTSRLPVHPSMLLRKLGSPVPKCSPKERSGSVSPSPFSSGHYQEGRQERELVWSREPVSIPSLIDSMKKRVDVSKTGDSSVLIGSKARRSLIITSLILSTDKITPIPTTIVQIHKAKRLESFATVLHSPSKYPQSLGDIGSRWLVDKVRNVFNYARVVYPLHV